MPQFKDDQSLSKTTSHLIPHTFSTDQHSPPSHPIPVLRLKFSETDSTPPPPLTRIDTSEGFALLCMPSGSAGMETAVSKYAGTWGAYNVQALLIVKTSPPRLPNYRPKKEDLDR
ncbi:hypothetical protein BDZ45DRAFT_237505 [Acephala macrosclerotiorum]|nr:hypothetical protein BDZ45DRAFT_237505 [Acephala macrosclerotiorum]